MNCLFRHANNCKTYSICIGLKLTKTSLILINRTRRIRKVAAKIPGTNIISYCPAADEKCTFHFAICLWAKYNMRSCSGSSMFRGSDEGGLHGRALFVAEAEGCAPTQSSDTITVRFKPLAQCWRRLAGVTIPRAKLLRHCLLYDSRCSVLTFCERSEWY